VAALDLERDAANLEVDPPAVAPPHGQREVRLHRALLDPGHRARLHLLALVLGDQVEDGVHRGQLRERVPAELLERGVGVHAAAVALDHDHALARLRQREQERLVAVGLLPQGALRRAALGDVADDDADAGDLARGGAHRPVRGDPVPRNAGAGGRRAGDLDRVERLAAAGHLGHVGLHLRRQVGQQLGDRAADVGRGRDPVDLGQPVVDPDVAQVGVQQRDADRRALERLVEEARARVARQSPGGDPPPDGNRSQGHVSITPGVRRPHVRAAR
jgi:hypothetical protein